MLVKCRALIIVVVVCLCCLYLTSCIDNTDTVMNINRDVQSGPLGQLYDTKNQILVSVSGNGISLENCKITDSDFTLPTTFTDGSKIDRVGDSAFSKNNDIISVSIPDGYELIGHFAFLECENLESVYLGKDVYDIGELAFTGCPKLKGFAVSDENPYLYEKSGCIIEKSTNTLLTTNGNIPEGVCVIGASVFGGNTNINDLFIPTSVEVIEGYAFQRSALKCVVIPDSVTTIQTHAFEQCNQLKEIYIPESVTTIGEELFYITDGIIINCEAESKPEDWDDNWLYGCENYTLNWGVKRD